MLSVVDRRRFRRNIGSVWLGAVLVAAACHDEPSQQGSLPVEPSFDRAITAAPKPAVYLPYRVGIPDTGALTRFPEPYDRRKHGPPLADTRPEANDAIKRGFYSPPKGQPRWESGTGLGLSGLSALSAAGNGNGLAMDAWQGWRLTAGRGVSARFDLPDPPIATIPAPRDGIIYAPTATPANFACVEVTSVHFNDRRVWPGPPPYGDAMAVFDFCDRQEFRYWVNTSTRTFRDPYVRSHIDEYGLTKKGYYISIVDANPGLPARAYDCWSALIYNFSVGRWEAKWTQCGVASSSLRKEAHGWVMHETLAMGGSRGTCYSMKSIAASLLAVQMPDGSWLSPPIHDEKLYNPTGTCWTNDTWRLLAVSVNGWRALTPGYSW